MNKNLKIGDVVKITGGKYKKYETGTLTCLKPTYCDVDFGANGQHKVKVDYIFPIVDMVVDMPDAEQLVDVGQNPDDFINENPELMKIEEEETYEEPIVDMEVLDPDEQEFAEAMEDLENKVNELTKENKYINSECAVFEAERDQADEKVMEQDAIIKRLTKRNQYLEEICRKLLLP